nr:tetraspanin [Hymenolepis microstoma]
MCMGFGGFIYYKINGEIIVASVHALPIFIMVLGVLLFFVSVFGFFGAVFFAFLLIVVILSEIVAGVISILYEDMIAETFNKLFIDSIHLWESTKSDAVLRSLRGIQNWLHCCGGNNSADWEGNQVQFCCKNVSSNCQADADQYQVGCGVRFREKVGDEAVGVGITLLIVCLIELISAFFAFTLAKAGRSQ